MSWRYVTALVVFACGMTVSLAQTREDCYSPSQVDSLTQVTLAKRFEVKPKQVSPFLDSLDVLVDTVSEDVGIPILEKSKLVKTLLKWEVPFRGLGADTLVFTLGRAVLRGKVKYWVENDAGEEILEGEFEKGQNQDTIRYLNNQASGEFTFVVRSTAPSFAQAINLSIQHILWRDKKITTVTVPQPEVPEPVLPNDTIATVLFEQFFDLPPKTYWSVNKITVNLEELGLGDYDYWLYYIGFGSDVPKRLAQFGIQGHSISGDPVMDYGMGLFPNLPEFTPEECTVQFTNQEDLGALIRPNVKIEDTKNKIPSMISGMRAKSIYYRVVSKNKGKNYLHILNYSRFKKEKVFVKIIGFQKVLP